MEFEELSKEHASYKQEIENLKFALQRTTEEYAQLHQQNGVFQSEIHSLKNARDESALQHQADIDGKNAELTNLNEQCCLAQQHIRELQLDVEQGVRTLKQQLREEQISSLEKIKDLKKELDSKSSFANTLKDDVDQLILKVTQVEEASAKKNKELLAMSIEADGLQTKLHQQAIEIRRRVEEISVLMKHEKKLLASVQKQQLEMDSKNAQLKCLSSTNKTLLKQRNDSKLEVCLGRPIYYAFI